MKHPIFSIRQLKCQYPGSAYPVLEIDDFDIYRGELIFILGVSGVGKSTLIESLGLMNRTIVPAPEASLMFHGANGDVSLFDLWESRQQELPTFRSDQYSFIFQNSNLFEKLTLAANAIMPALASTKDSSILRKEAEVLVADLLKKVSKQEYQVKNAGAISGGQKQRLAFIQAMVSPHEVLFGDEPTGNLDWGNAKKVMTTLSRHIKENNKTGLVVSHDVPLSVSFADRIVLLTAKKDSQEGTNTGVILPENVFEKTSDGWTTSNLEFSEGQLMDFLKNHFESHAA